MARSIAELLAAASLRVLPLEQSQSIWQSGETEEQKLYELLKLHFPAGHVYPDTAHEQREYPDCVYSMSGADARQYRGIDTSHWAMFGLSIRHTNRADLAEKAREVATGLHSKAGVAILDRASVYDKDVQCYVMAMEVLSSVPVGFDVQSEQPFALLTLPGKCESVPPQSMNCVAQTTECEHHVIFHAATLTGLKQQREAVNAALLGNVLEGSLRPLAHRRGDPIQADGGLLGWVDVWFDSYRLQKTNTG